MTTLQAKYHYHSIIKRHETWLREHSLRAATEWGHRLSNDCESAIAEAWVANVLANGGIDITPRDVGPQGGPDFACKSAEGEVFFVEVANLDTDALTTDTGLPVSVDAWQGGGVGCILTRIFNKRRNKHEQVKKHQISDPVVLAFTGFHETATFIHFSKSSVEMALVPPTQLCIPIPNRSRETRAAFEEPILDTSLFFKRLSNRSVFTSACPELSAVLFFAIPWKTAEGDKPVVRGVLNPTALHALNPRTLPFIPFYQLTEGWDKTDPCSWEVNWVNE